MPRHPEPGDEKTATAIELPALKGNSASFVLPSPRLEAKRQRPLFGEGLLRSPVAGLRGPRSPVAGLRSPRSPVEAPRPKHCKDGVRETVKKFELLVQIARHPEEHSTVPDWVTATLLQDLRNANSKNPRLDAVVAKLMKEHGLANDVRPSVGPIPGVAVGEVISKYREALCLIGVHPFGQRGIGYDKTRSIGPATSVVVSDGDYVEDEDYGDVIIYSGENSKSRGHQTSSPGNRALGLCRYRRSPVRVCKKHKGGSAFESCYVYEGLFDVVDFISAPGKEGHSVYLALLLRRPHQPPRHCPYHQLGAGNACCRSLGCDSRPALEKLGFGLPRDAWILSSKEQGDEEASGKKRKRD